MPGHLQKTDLYHSNKMNKYFEGDCFTVNVQSLQLSSDKERYQVLDEICIKEKLFAIGEHWRKVDYEHCTKLLHTAFATDLAYDDTRLGKKKTQKLAQIVLKNIQPGTAHCFTNWVDDPWKEGGGRSWNSITKHTIDIAVVLFDADKLVFTYAISED